MELKVETALGELTVRCSDDENKSGFRHVEAMSTASSKTDALSLVSGLLDWLASGRVTYIRVTPQANSGTDFETKKLMHRGYVRFSTMLPASIWPDIFDCNFLHESTDTGQKDRLITRTPHA